MFEFMGAYQLCMCCGAHSKLYQDSNEILSEGWIVEINFAICPECRSALFEMIREYRKNK